VSGTSETGYDELRTAKEQQADELIDRYSGFLEEGVRLSIEFSSKSEDERDQDLDFEVIIAPNTTTVSGSVPIADEDLELSKLEFEERIFAQQELVDFGMESSVANQHIDDWVDRGVLHVLQPRGSRDPFTIVPLYSFDVSRADRRRYSGQREKYGYVNPRKRSFVGLQILAKSLLFGPPVGCLHLRS
jgi:hypothetical protein